MVRDAPRHPRRCAASSRRRSCPQIKDIEHGDEPPYDVLRKMVATFGLKDMAEARFAHQIAKEKARAAARRAPAAERRSRGPNPEAGNEVAMQMIPIIELCRTARAW